MRKIFWLILPAALLIGLAIKTVGAAKTRSNADDNVSRLLWWVFVGWWWRPMKWLLNSVL